MKAANRLLSGLAVCLVFSSLATANLAVPGAAPVAPDILTVGGTATLIDHVSGSLTSGTVGATYNEWVFSDPLNSLCAGCLDFLIEVANGPTPGDPLTRITGTSFEGDGTVVTDVGVNLTGAPGVAATGGVAPGTVDRSVNGSVVGFNYGNVTPLGNNKTTTLLEIITNVTRDRSGLLGALDGAGAQAPGFGVAPEPNVIGLLILGLVAIGAVAHRRKTAV